MKSLKKVFIPLIALALAFVMIFATACNPDSADEKATYTVTYLVNGKRHDEQSYKDGDPIAAPEEPVVTGYLFKSWNTSEDGSGSQLVEGTPVTSNMTYYAILEEIAPSETTPDPSGPSGPSTPSVKTWTVTFETNGGTAVEPEQVEDGKTITRLNPYRDGYDFAGWYTDSNCTKPFLTGTAITDNITLYAGWTVKSTSGGGSSAVETFTVTFMSDGTVYQSQSVESGKTATEPTKPQKSGYQFTGWYLEGASSAFNFNTAITASITLIARFESLPAKILDTGAYNESLFVEWQEGAPASARVEYKLTTQSAWTEVDAPLIRATSATEARVDILGLAAGSYNVKITASDGSVIELSSPVSVTAYDRSGYAHFNYTDGVGAYNDDGTLKDNALVIYVTNENKDYVMDEVCAENADVNMFKIPYYSGSSGTNWNKNASGIGWWLNNNQYTASNAGSSKNKEPSNTYDPANGGKLGFKSVDRPIVVRFIGTVETPEGCTAYNSVYEGGGVDDNGHMARLKNLKNVTLEGVGEDAVIKGWGFHFVIGTDAKDGQGTSFEVRNLTFLEYPEDAIGMEGQQEKVNGVTQLTASVERCWIHNNTFLPGRCDNPTESDKKEGDGSCDFKRGQYFTCSYNWFEYCHKTNLIGSSDDSLQYNMTYHHNVWWQCGSRIPLTRQANVHFYNNYIMVDQTETTTPYSWISKPAPSYVHSLRANCYLFSEANYYDGCKNITDGKTGGAAKGWNNMVYANLGTNTIEEVSSREQTVSNSCKYLGTDYSRFDTNPNLFYYDADNKVSDCLLDDAVTARQRSLMYSGANGHGITGTAMNKYTPSTAVSVPESGLKITLPTAKGDTEISGVMFRGLTGVSSGTIKYKGQGITFTLTAPAQLTVTTTTTGDPAPELLGASGRVYAHKFTGTLTMVLEAGTYIIASGQKDKEAVITALSFENTSASSQARIDAAIDAIDNLPATAELTDTFAAKLKEAQNAYNALTSAERVTFGETYPEYVSKLNKVANDYSVLQIENVRALISAIGDVNEDSYSAINAAQVAYDALTSEQKAQLAADKAILDAAWAEYEQYAVTNVINLIDAFAAKVDALTESADRATIEALIAEGEAAQMAYDTLSEASDEDAGQQSQVTNYSKLGAGMTKLEGLYNIYLFRDQLEYFADNHTVTLADSGNVNNLIKLYEALSAAQKNMLTAQENELYASVKAAYEKAQSELITSNFLGGQPSSDLFKHVGTKQNAKGEKFFVYAANTEFASGLKFESSTKLELTLTSAKVLKLYFNIKATDIKIDGNAYTVAPDGDDQYVVTVTLEAGTHTIERGSGEIYLYYATLQGV